MAAGKWIGGFLGFITGGPLGALAGFVLGALFDLSMEGSTQVDNLFQDRDEDSARQQYQQQVYEGQRNSFLFSLLVLSSYIIKADGKVMHSEMEVVRNFLRSNFGERAVQQGEQIMRKLFEEQQRMGTYEFQRTIQSSCAQIAANMDYSQRLQLFNFLFMIAKADGRVTPEEVTALQEIAQYMSLSAADTDSMMNLERNDLESAYKVLGITSAATDEEVKAAYRKMALKHHPDRVATLGEDVRKAAEKKFQEINEAKERIYKARGIR